MALRRGNPGNKGGGRPVEVWRQRLRTMAERNAAMRRLEKALDSEKGSEFWKALEYVTEHGHGKAPQPQEHGGTITVTVKRADD